MWYEDEATMSLYNYFHPVSYLPMSQQSSLSEHTTFEPNKAVEWVLEKKKTGERQKYSSFTDEDCATIGKFAKCNYKWVQKSWYYRFLDIKHTVQDVQSDIDNDPFADSDVNTD